MEALVTATVTSILTAKLDQFQRDMFATFNTLNSNTVNMVGALRENVLDLGGQVQQVVLTANGALPLRPSEFVRVVRALVGRFVFFTETQLREAILVAIEEVALRNVPIALRISWTAANIHAVWELQHKARCEGLGQVIVAYQAHFRGVPGAFQAGFKFRDHPKWVNVTSGLNEVWKAYAAVACEWLLAHVKMPQRGGQLMNIYTNWRAELEHNHTETFVRLAPPVTRPKAPTLGPIEERRQKRGKRIRREQPIGGAQPQHQRRRLAEEQLHATPIPPPAAATAPPVDAAM